MLSKFHQILFFTFFILFQSGCSSNTIHKYSKNALVLTDNDNRDIDKKPEEYFSPKLWDFFDQNFMRRITHSFLLRTKSESRNANTFDEVPNSAWFTNRIGLKGEMSIKEIRKGSCEKAESEINAPWFVVKGKPNGANPGFMIKDSKGNNFMLKFDGLDQPELATAADVIGSKIYYAAGYYAPCNKVVYFDPSILKISPKANRKNKLGKKVRMTQADIDKAMSNTRPLPNGKVRASISQFLPGAPIGPFKYQGVREDDPNDIIEHEHRRELRGGKVIASWINHFDAREQNSLDIWVKNKETGKGHVRHYYLDFGDSFGSLWAWDGVSRRHGSSYYIDPAHMMADLFSFGLKERPWHRRTYGRAGATLGYFNVDHFNAEGWKNGYHNPAFSEATEHDSAWMGRILAKFTDEHIHALVDEGKIRNKLVDKELRRVLIGRRDKILFRWLKTLSPLTNPYSSNGRICMEDLALLSKIVDPATRAYDAFLWEGKKTNFLGPQEVKKNGDHEICVALNYDRKTSRKDQYFVLEIVATNTAHTSEGKLIKPNRPSLKLHFYAQENDSFNIVAVERDEKPNFDLPLQSYSNLVKTNHYFNDGSPDMTIGEVPE